MKRCLLAACLLWQLAAFDALAQEQPTVDELKQELANLSDTSEAQIPVLANLVRACWRSCPGDAVEYGNKALSLLSQWPDVEHETTVLVYLPRIYLRTGEYEQARALIARGLDVAQQQDDKSKLAGIQFNQAIYYSDQKQFILAQNAYQRLYQTYAQLEHQSGMGSALNNLGRIHRREHNYGKALELYQQALAIYQEGNIIHNRASTLTNIGEIYRLIGDFEMAESTISEALKSIEPQQYPNIHTWASVSLASLYIDQQRYNDATTLLLQSLSHYEHINSRYTSVEIYAKLAKAALKNGQLDKALEYYQNGVSQLPDELPEMDALSFKEVEVELKIAQNQLGDAEAILTPIFASIKADDISDQKFFLFKRLIDVLNMQEKWQESAQLLMLYLEQYQAQVDLNRESRLEQFNVIYQASEKEREIAELQQQNNANALQLLNEQASRRQTLSISAIIAIILFGVIYVGIQKRKVLKMETLVLQLEAAKKRRLFSDISHELRTPLSVLKLQLESLEYDLEDNPKQAYQLLHAKLASMNNLISDISHLAKADAGELQLSFQTVTVKAFVQQWCQEFRSLPEDHGLRFDYHVDIAEATQTELDPERIKQVLSNLLSNSCRYTDAPGRIRFQASIDQASLQLSLEDSAPGLDDEQLMQIFDRLYSANAEKSEAVGGSGLGLAICKSLIEAHQGSIHAEKSELGGIKIGLMIPLNSTNRA